jgi:transposase
MAKGIFLQLYEQFKRYDEQAKHYDKQIKENTKNDSRCAALQDIEGIGPITASAIVATIGDPSVFKNGREVSAGFGLVPKQHSSGNKIILGSITKRGDKYVRTLFIHGARTVIKTGDNKTDKKSEWA